MRSRVLLVILILVLVALPLTGYVLGGRPRFVHKGAGSIVALQADDSGIVWLETEGAEPGSAGRILALGDGSRSAKVIYPEPRAINLALNGDQVLVMARDGDSGELLSVPRSGGQARTVAEGLRHPGGLYADGGTVYWTETIAAGIPHVSYIPALLPRTLLQRGSTEGQGDPQTLGAIEASDDGFHGSLLGLHGERLYWIDVSGVTGHESWSTIRSVPSAGGLVETVVREKGVGAAMLERDALYWTAPSGDAGDPVQCCSVRRAPLPDGAPVTLTDWLMVGGSLCRIGGRLYYAGVDGLWVVPEKLSLPRQVRRSVLSRGLAVGWRGALYEVVHTAEGQDGILRRPLTVGARLRAAAGLL